uniref:Uncharacterized protein n=1 Tax=Rhizophora mucronata TaxID=61149 RepID=A0A2P2Q9P3_RHIMU
MLAQKSRRKKKKSAISNYGSSDGEFP